MNSLHSGCSGFPIGYVHMYMEVGEPDSFDEKKRRHRPHLAKGSRVLGTQKPAAYWAQKRRRPRIQPYIQTNLERMRQRRPFSDVHNVLPVRFSTK